MTDLSRLNVSLTKHGAHKISQLLRLFDAGEILDNLNGSVPRVNIELAQAKKNLSAYSGDQVPEVWNRIRTRGQNTINSSVLVTIIFSHYKLINAMQQSSNRSTFRGSIHKGQQLNGKAYTNFAHILDELGFATLHNSTQVDYNFEPLFSIVGLNELIRDLLSLKLEKANWDKSNSILDEMITLNFQDVFSVDTNFFSNWFSGISASVVEENNLPIIEDEATGTFEFTPGHTPRQTGTTERATSEHNSYVNLFHNSIQNELFEQLAQEYGEDFVSTEQSTGQGTSIDLVVKTDTFCWFYEVKTANTVKACIREAISQLLEYAYWQELDFEVGKLIIVSPLETTEEAERYLAFFRDNFGLEIYYEQFIART